MDGLNTDRIEVGTEIPQWATQINLLQLLRYAAATWNFFLLHLSREYAQNMGLKDANIHAPLYGALLAKTVTDWVGDPGVLRKLSYKVKVMGFPGDNLIFRGRIAKKYLEGEKNILELDMWVENQEGIEVAVGSATVCLSPGE